MTDKDTTEPEGSNLIDTVVSRRSFLLIGLSGAAVGAVARITGPFEAIDKIGREPVVRNLPERFLKSVCSDCSAGCEIRLRQVGDNIVGVRPVLPKPCLRAYAIPQQLVHPDRLTQPMRRLGDRGGNRWEAITAADGEGRIRELLQQNGKRTAIAVRDDGELSSFAMQALAQDLGAPVIATAEWRWYDSPAEGFEELSGWRDWQADLSHATGVITFGRDLLQSSSRPVDIQEVMRNWQTGARRQIVSVGPRLDVTAMKADKWLACNVGAEPLVAWTIAAILAQKKLYDRGATNLAGFGGCLQDLEQFDIARACTEAGVRVGDVDRLARHLARRRWLCVGPRRRLTDQRPVVVLNALLGHIGKTGGWLPRARIEPRHTAADNDFESIPDRVAAGDIDLIVLYGCNPVLSSPQPERWRRALRAASHVVVFAETYDESCRFADLVAPIPHAAERTTRFVTAANGKIELRTTEPAVHAIPGRAVPPDLALTLAQQLGATDVADLRAVVDAVAAGLQVVEPTVHELHLHRLEWQPPEYTPGDFHLLFETPPALLRMSGAHLPYLVTCASPHLRRWWETTIEINPEVARRRGIRDNDLVRVSSSTGTVEARAKLYAGVPPNAVCMPLGLGRKVGKFAARIGGNPAELIAGATPASGALWDNTRVTLEVV